MKLSTITFYAFMFFMPLTYAQKKQDNKKLLQLIPEPNQLIDLNNNFLIKSPNFKTNIKGLDKEFQFFVNYLEKQYNFKIQSSRQGTTIFTLRIDSSLKTDKKEAYQLYINHDSITIVGKDKVGVFRGIQTLIQLFPFEKKKFTIFSLPCVNIIDEPRFNYRGNHLDVARHFFPVSYLKKYIDWLAWYKFNYFHWHLTDDQGWRIEIKAFSKLQSIAAYRDETLVGRYGSNKYDGKRYGGYYTQEEVKDIVKYATDRFITVIPEIEMPGHAMAVLSAYPELGCKDTVYKAATTWGVMDDVFCGGNEKTYTFLEKVLDEVCTLFPSYYIHIGGDECPKIRWKECGKCQEKIKSEKLKNEEELQSYLVKRIEKYLQKKGRSIIGWDEILEGGVTQEAIIMAWRGEEEGIKAAKLGNRVIMSPTSHSYLDYTEKKNDDSILIGGYLPLEKVYSFSVAPKQLSPEEQKLIIGGQANVWTEYIPNPAKLEYIVFPRIAAMSESLWTYPEHKKYYDFLKKILIQIKAYKMQNTNYNKAFLGMNYKFKKNNDTVFLSLKTVLNNGQYLLKVNDNVMPIVKKNKFFNIPILSSGKYNILLMNNKNERIDELNFNFNLNDAFGKNIIWLNGASYPYYGNGTSGLVDGLIAEKNDDKQWMGFSGKDAIFYIDLGEIKPIKTIQAHFKEEKNRGIHAPKDFLVEYSNDGNIFNFKPLEIQSEEKGNFIKDDWWTLNIEKKTRYLKITFQNIGKIPKGNPFSNTNAWLFVDEFRVN
ncbi:MAG: glycoside hydrolase family 20 protein [Chitinophagaceae bacterium]